MQRKLFSMWRFLVFFSLIAFVVTCCFFLFLKVVDIPDEIIRQRAGVTFINVIMLSLVFASIDCIRRNYLVERPIRKLVEATDLYQEILVNFHL